MACTVCNRRPLADGRTVCGECIDAFRRSLNGLPVLMEALAAAVGGRLRHGENVGGRSADTPMPVNMDASRTAHHARTRIVSWTSFIARRRRETLPATWAEIERFLDVRAMWLASQDFGPEAVAVLIDSLRAVVKTVDKPAQKHYAGPCTGVIVGVDGVEAGCGGELYARPGAAVVACPRCAAEYDVESRRAWMLSEVWDAVATGPDIVRALAGHAFGNVDINLSTLRGWALNGRLVRVDTVSGRPRYRVGDVLELATGIQRQDRVLDTAGL